MVATGSGYSMPQIIIPNLNLQDRREFVTKPLEQYMIGTGSPLLKVVNDVTGDGWDMDTLQGTDVLLQPGHNEDFTPMGETNVEGRRLYVDPFKVNMKWSRAQFYGTILEKLGGREFDRAFLESTEGGRAVLQAVMQVVTQDINRNIFDVFLWGNKSLSLSDLSCVPTNTKLSAADMKSRAFSMFKNTNGLFARLKENTGCLVGQLAHNETALPDGYAIDAFEMVRDKSGRALEYADENEIAIICSGSIYKNYQRYLISLGVVADSYRVQENGVRVALWEGIPIYPINSFHAIDRKFFNKTNRHFVGLAKNQTICLGSDIIASDSKPMFEVGPYPKPNDKQTWGKAEFKIGANLAFPEFTNFALSWEAAN